METERVFFCVDSSICQQFEACNSKTFGKNLAEETFGAMFDENYKNLS